MAEKVNGVEEVRFKHTAAAPPRCSLISPEIQIFDAIDRSEADHVMVFILTQLLIRKITGR